MTLACDGLTIRVAERLLVEDLDIVVEPGAFVCVLGPNGVGKTLTLHTLAGLREPAAGRVLLYDDPIDDLDRRTIARRLGLLLQHHEDAFPITVLEAALMGRHARLGFWQWESRADVDIAVRALAEMDVAALASRATATLSGGERRRVALATLLVQDPDVLLLDEPLNHLDPLHRLRVMDTVARLCAAGKTTIATLHDPTLAARYADFVLLLSGDGRWTYGPADDVLTTGHLERLYGTPFSRYSDGTHSALLPAV